MKKIILGYPYDGALFWLLTTSEHHNAKDGRPYSGGHPYYERLYGPKHIEFAPRAASLCVLYDEVIAAPADIGLPDRQSYQSNNEYFNPHLGLRTNWLDFRTAQEWLEEQVRRDLEIPAVVNTLPTDPWARKFFLERTNLQILLALKYDAKILAGPSFFKTLEAKFAHSVNAEEFRAEQTEAPIKPQLLSEYFDISSFEFKKLDYDRIIALRADKTIKDYAKQFNQALDQAVDAEDPSKFFFSKMEDTLKRKDVMNQVERGFSTGGTFVTLAGLHPLVKGIAKPFGLVLKAAGAGLKAAGRRDSWMLLGQRMSEVVFRNELKKKTKRG